jgi:hypothetical protein
VEVVVSVEMWIRVVWNAIVDGVIEEEVLVGAEGFYITLGCSFGEYVCLNTQLSIHIHQTVARSNFGDFGQYEFGMQPLITFTSYCD